jgi:hypothetical protein
MGTVLVVLFDWLGIIVYLQSAPVSFQIGLEILHLRLIILVYVFLQLREISLADNKDPSHVLIAAEPLKRLSQETQSMPAPLLATKIMTSLLPNHQ